LIWLPRLSLLFASPPHYQVPSFSSTCSRAAADAPSSDTLVAMDGKALRGSTPHCPDEQKAQLVGAVSLPSGRSLGLSAPFAVSRSASTKPGVQSARTSGNRRSKTSTTRWVVIDTAPPGTSSKPPVFNLRARIRRGGSPPREEKPDPFRPSFVVDRSNRPAVRPHPLFFLRQPPLLSEDGTETSKARIGVRIKKTPGPPGWIASRS